MPANEAYLVDEVERSRIADRLYFFFRDGMGEKPEELGLKAADYPDSHISLAELLSMEEGVDLSEPYADVLLSWKPVEKRIRRLIQEVKYLSPKEKKPLRNIKSNRHRKRLNRRRSRWNVTTKV